MLRFPLCRNSPLALPKGFFPCACLARHEPISLCVFILRVADPGICGYPPPPSLFTWSLCQGFLSRICSSASATSPCEGALSAIPGDARSTARQLSYRPPHAMRLVPQGRARLLSWCRPNTILGPDSVNLSVAFNGATLLYCTLPILVSYIIAGLWLPEALALTAEECSLPGYPASPSRA